MICYIVLAAGKSVRMKSATPKILFPLLGKPLLQYVLDALPANQKDIFIVSNVPYADYQCIPQSEPLGTGHAVLEALRHIPKHYTECVVVCGDTPLLTPETIEELAHATTDIVLTGFSITDLSQPYGRLVNDGETIVEYKEASPKEKIIPYVYAGVMKIKRHILDETLPRLMLLILNLYLMKKQKSHS